jgi:hypothetical protein
MFAVALYALPNVLDEIPVLQIIHRHADESVRPYILLTSQWQKWPLFAPDPLRRVMQLRIESQHHDNTWSTSAVLSKQHTAWWRQAKEVKILDRLYDADKKQLLQLYVTLQCNRFGLQPGSALRYRIEYYVVPKNDVQHTLQWWKQWKPEWQNLPFTHSLCSLYPNA